MRIFARLLLLTTFVALAACGGGGGGSPSPSTPPLAAPSGLSYSPAASTFAVGHSINPLTPTVTGAVTSYAVNPALPAGLSLDAATGAISGTPSAIVAAASYVVTATNSAGSATTNVAIGVSEAAPVVSYERSLLTLTTGLPVTLAPMSTGGPVTAWSISPALPAGLAFNTTNGTISGTPTGTSSTSQYVVSALNSGGTNTFDLTISIDSGVLLDLGHAAEIALIRHDGNRVLSVDREGHWALWNDGTTARIASGNVTCQSSSNCGARGELAGGVAAVGNVTSVEVRSANDGHVLFTVPSPVSWWELASDGSYITAGTSQALTAWSPTGTMLFTRAGNYSQADAFAAATEVRVAKGPAGASVIEKVTAATGAFVNGAAFNGTFHSWFLDGERFFTSIGNTIWVYGHDSQQQDIKAMPTLVNLTGQGQRFWTREIAPIVIYTVGASGSPTATFSFSSTDHVMPSGMTIGVRSFGPPTFSVINLADATPSRVDVTLPVAYMSTYAARSDMGWLIGNWRGAVVDATNSPGAPRYFGYGRARSIVASDNRIAVATTVGGILFFDATTREQEGQIDFSSSQLRLSSDGTVLAAAANNEDAQFVTDRTVKVFALPSAAEIQNIPYTYPNPYPFDIALSGSGQVLGKLVRNWSGNYKYRREATPVGGGAELWSDTLAGGSDRPEEVTLHLSPSGTRIAGSDGSSFTMGATHLIENGSLVSAVQGGPLGWIDEDRLLVNRYIIRLNMPIYTNSVIVSPTGQVTHSVVLPEMRYFQTVDTNRIYSPKLNQIVSLASGQVVWSSPNSSPFRDQGAVTGTHVVFASGATVRMESY